MVIEGKSIQSFIKKYPSSTRIILTNPTLWKSLSFVEDDGSTWPGNRENTQCTANPLFTSLLKDVCKDSSFHVMDNNRFLEDLYTSLNEMDRFTHVLYTEDSFVKDGVLQRKELLTQFQQLFMVIDRLKEHPNLSSNQKNLSIIIPTLFSGNNKLELEYLTQLFCIYLQKARTLTDSPEVTVYFLVQDNKNLASYRNSYERLVSSASLVI